MTPRIALIIVFLCAPSALAQGQLAPMDVLKHLEKFNAYGEVDRRDKEHVFLNVQFRYPGPKPADIGVIAEIVKQSATPVMLNLNQNQALDDAALAPLKGMKQLVGLGLGGTKVGDAGLETVATLTNLETLYLSGDSITDAGIKHLSGLTKLRKLSAYCKKVTEAAYVHIEKMVDLEELTLGDNSDKTDKMLESIKGMTKLRELSLKRDQVTDAGMACLKNFKALRSLRIEGGKMTAAGFEHLAGLDQLESLTLLSCPPFVTEQGFACLKGMKALKELEVIYGGCPNAAASAHLKSLTSLKGLRFDSVSKGCLEGLRGHPTIERLSLFYSGAEDAALEPLLEMPTLKALNLMNTRITDDALKLMKNLKQLKELNIDTTRITDAGLEHLTPLTSLETLYLSENKLDGSGLRHLAALPKLRVLSLSGNPINDAALTTLKDFKGLTELNLTGTRTTVDPTLALKKALSQARIRDFAGDDVELNPRKRTRVVGADLTERKPDYTLSAEEFHAEYKKGSQAAAEKYKKKIIELTGVVDNIGRNIGSDPYIILKVEKELIGVYCTTRDDEPWLKVLPGQTVKVKGEWPEFSVSAAIVNSVIVDPGKRVAVEMTAQQLADAFAKDPKALEEKHKDKFIILTGKVVERQFNSVGAASVTLATTGNVKVKCSFTAFEKDGVKALKIGDEVKIAGQYTFNFGGEEVGLYFCLLFGK